MARTGHVRWWAWAGVAVGAWGTRLERRHSRCAGGAQLHPRRSGGIARGGRRGRGGSRRAKTQRGARCCRPKRFSAPLRARHVIVYGFSRRPSANERAWLRLRAAPHGTDCRWPDPPWGAALRFNAIRRSITRYECRVSCGTQANLESSIQLPFDFCVTGARVAWGVIFSLRGLAGAEAAIDSKRMSR